MVKVAWVVVKEGWVVVEADHSRPVWAETWLPYPTFGMVVAIVCMSFVSDWNCHFIPPSIWSTTVYWLQSLFKIIYVYMSLGIGDGGWGLIIICPIFILSRKLIVLHKHWLRIASRLFITSLTVADRFSSNFFYSAVLYKALREGHTPGWGRHMWCHTCKSSQTNEEYWDVWKRSLKS